MKILYALNYFYSGFVREKGRGEWGETKFRRKFSFSLGHPLTRAKQTVKKVPSTSATFYFPRRVESTEENKISLTIKLDQRAC